MSDDRLQHLHTVHKMHVKCSFRLRNLDRPGFAASDCCGQHATTAVVDGPNRLYRCPEHQGMVDATRTGNTVTAVWLTSDS